MSSNTNDPLEEQDTSTESEKSEEELEKAEGNLELLKIAEKDISDESKAGDSANQEGNSSSSDDLFDKIYTEQRGVEKAEGNLELLKIAEKSESDESKIAGSANQEGKSSSSDDLFNRIYAEQKTLQKPHSHGSSDPEGKVTCSTAPSKEKEMENKRIDKNIGTEMVEEFHKTGSPASMEEGDADYARSTPPVCQYSTRVTPTSMLQEISPATAGSSLRVDYDDDIPLALADPLRSISPHRSSSSRGFDDSTTGNENTLADVSEIDSEIAEMSREGSVHYDALKTIDKKESAVERQSTEGSDTDISEIQDSSPPQTSESSSPLQCMAPPPTPESSRSLQGMAPRPTSESSSLLQDYLPPPPTPASSIGSTSNPSGILESKSIANDPVSGDQRMEVCEGTLEQEQQKVEHMEEMNVSEDARKRTSASILLVKKSIKVQDVEEGSPSKRRRASMEVGGSSVEDGIAYRLRSRKKQESEQKCKSSDLHSTSESPEPKSSSSEEFHLKEFPEGKNTSGARRTSNAKKVSSKDSVMAEMKEDQTSALREQGLPSMDTEDTSFVMMETTVGEGEAELMEPSGTKPSTSSAYGSEGTFKEHEHSIGDFEYEESVEKSEKERKLRGRSDLELTCRTRRDSGDADMKVDIGNLQKSGSTSSRDVSDISTISPSEEETKF